MKTTNKEVERCGDCYFFFLKEVKGGRIPYCSFYPNLIWYRPFSAEKEKHPKCKVTEIVINET